MDLPIRTMKKDAQMDVNKRPWSLPQIIVSAVLAVFIWSAVGFNWFGFGFNWSTNLGATRMSEAAVLENLAGICVAQARSEADSAVQIKQLRELEIWKRRDFVETSEWATMPGSESANSGVADLCIVKLLET
jgi:hypothetical protein